MNRVLLIALAFSLAAWAVMLWGALSLIDFIRRGWFA